MTGFDDFRGKVHRPPAHRGGIARHWDYFTQHISLVRLEQKERQQHAVVKRAVRGKAFEWHLFEAEIL